MASRKSPRGAKDAPGMKGERSRTKKGPLRTKRGDTRADTVEKEYGLDLNVRGDKKLTNVLKDERVLSLKKLIEKKRR
jgi:hypothetical protein